MDRALKARGEIDFSEAGDGVILRLSNAALKRIEEDRGHLWFQELAGKMMEGTSTITDYEYIVRHAARKNGEPFEITDAILEDIPIQALGEKAFEAITRAMRGMSAKDFMEDVFRQFRERAGVEGEDPFPKTEEMTTETPSSTPSDETASAAASASKSSGTSPRSKPSSTSRKRQRPS